MLVGRSDQCRGDPCGRPERLNFAMRAVFVVEFALSAPFHRLARLKLEYFRSACLTRQRSRCRDPIDGVRVGKRNKEMQLPTIRDGLRSNRGELTK